MALLGLLYTLLLFICCFVLVHLVKLAQIGLKSLNPPPKEEEKTEEKPKKEEAPKPVYYIVEKKRAKRNYSKPREIEFK